MLLRCDFAFDLPILEYCSPVWGSADECHLQLLERQVYSVARLYPDESFLSLCYRRRVTGLSIFYEINSNSNHCLFSDVLSASTEFNIPELRQQLIQSCSLKFQGIERPNLLGLSCRPRFEYGMIFPTLCLTQYRWICLMVQSTVGCFPELCFLQFSVGLWVVKTIYKQLCFPTWVCAAGFNNNNNNNTRQYQYIRGRAVMICNRRHQQNTQPCPNSVVLVWRKKVI